MNGHFADLMRWVETRSHAKVARRLREGEASLLFAAIPSLATIWKQGFLRGSFAQTSRDFALRTLLLGVALFAIAALANAQSSELTKADAKVEQRLRLLADELRCLVCQNQTIADSNAPLALDLRNQIRTQIGEGKSDDQIRDYMVQRYGDFVLYRPPFKATTALRWVGPFALVLLGAGVMWMLVRRRRPDAKVEVKPARKRELQKLLEEER